MTGLVIFNLIYLLIALRVWWNVRDFLDFIAWAIIDPTPDMAKVFQWRGFVSFGAGVLWPIFFYKLGASSRWFFPRNVRRYRAEIINDLTGSRYFGGRTRDLGK